MTREIKSPCPSCGIPLRTGYDLIRHHFVTYCSREDVETRWSDYEAGIKAEQETG